MTKIPHLSLNNQMVEKRIKALIVGVVVLIVASATISTLNLDFIISTFFLPQPTITGWVINSLTLFLFLSSLAVLARLSARYYVETAEIKRYLTSISRTGEIMRDAKLDNILGERIALLESLAQQNQPFDHGAMASIVLSEESSRFQYSRFVNSILILIGVLGTVISLSIALLGAADFVVITSLDNGPMNMMMHGMSTALSTTALAIVAYVIHSYFLSSVKGIQVSYLSYLEEVTMNILIPSFRARLALVTHAEEPSSLTDSTLSEILNQLHRLNVSNQRIQELLNRGFRLSELDS